MKRHDQPSRSTVNDDEAYDPHDITQEFWGATGHWSSTRREPPRNKPQSEPTGMVSALRDGVAAFRPRVTARPQHGLADRTREHGIVRPRTSGKPVSARREASIAELASGARSVRRVEHVNVEGRTQLLDPLLPGIEYENGCDGETPSGGRRPATMRLAALAVVTAIVVPVAVRSKVGGENKLAVVAPVSTLVANSTATSQPTSTVGLSPVAQNQPTQHTVVVAQHATPVVASTSTVPSTVPASGPGPAPAPPVASVAKQAVAPTTTSVAVTVVAASQEPEKVAASATVNDIVGATAPSRVTTAPATTTPSCDNTYAAGHGDSWYRIAEQAEVSVDALLAQNRAVLDTVIYPKSKICLPAGAKQPTPPATTQPAVTAAPAQSTTKPSRSAPTAPPTTASRQTTMTTAALPSNVNASPEEVKALIREIWPDELEEKALQIAYRESRYRPTAFNGVCCYGVFQMYYSVHAGWLKNYDIHSAQDLYDPRKNVTAAYALYQRSGGWNAWRQTAY